MRRAHPCARRRPTPSPSSAAAGAHEQEFAAPPRRARSAPRRPRPRRRCGRATSAVPSFTRLSPSTRATTRSGTPSRRKTAVAATVSVGGDHRAQDEGRGPSRRPGTAAWATTATQASRQARRARRPAAPTPAASVRRRRGEDSHAGGVQERRQEDEEDHVGRDLDLRDPGQVADAHAGEHEQDRVRDPKRAGQPDGPGGDREQREQELDVVHRSGR